MTTPLARCSTCHRHVRADETRCPFCRAARVATVIALVSLTAGGDACKSDNRGFGGITAVYGPAPATSDAAPPAADAGDDAGLTLGHGRGTEGMLAVYGPPPMTDAAAAAHAEAMYSDIVEGDVPEAGRAIAQTRPKLRAIYQLSLRSDAGKAAPAEATFAMTVDASGAVTKVTVTNEKGLSAETLAAMKRVLTNTVFQKPPKAPATVGMKAEFVPPSDAPR